MPTSPSNQRSRARGLVEARRPHNRNVQPAEQLRRALGEYVSAGYSTVVKALLDAGANPNLTPADANIYETPLASALYNNEVGIAKMLLQAGAIPHWNVQLQQAVWGNALEAVQFCLDHGGNPNKLTELDTNEISETKPEVLRLLLRYGLNPNRLDADLLASLGLSKPELRGAARKVLS